MVYKRSIKAFILLAGIILALSACKHDRNQPGYAYMAENDMYYADPYEPYTENPLFKDSVTMQSRVEGTVPRGYIPYPYKAKDFAAQQAAGEELKNPYDATPEIIAKGKEQYEIFCISCHGEQGKGDGYLHSSGKFTAKPTSLIDDYVKNKPDGEIYHVITLGSLSGLMGAHGAQVTPENRWKIITYVRELQRNN